jgi:hypothetical protein
LYNRKKLRTLKYGPTRRTPGTICEARNNVNRTPRALKENLEKPYPARRPKVAERTAVEEATIKLFK